MQKRSTPHQDTTPHVQAVEATSGGLIRATLGAAAAASLILILFWLPAEYGIDPTGAGRVMGLTQMGEIKQQLYAEAAAEDAALAAQATAPTQVAVAESLPTEAANEQTPASAEAGWRDEVSYTLPPGEGVEVKLVMKEGATAEFHWTANGAVLNHDTHGDGGGQNIMYERGRSVAHQEGTLTAAFTGNHGWFWRNRSDAPVTFSLRTRGDYVEMRAP